MILLSGYEGLSTYFYIDVFQEIEDIDVVKKIITDEIDRFGSVYSRFNKDSLLTTLNTKKKVGYDEDLARMLVLGKEMEDRTSGVFSLFNKTKLETKGYGSSSQQEDMQGEFRITTDSIELISGAIDLGGIGKGYLVDKLAKMLREDFGILYFLINAGGDMYATSDNGQPVTVYMQHPINHEVVIGKFSLYNQSFCSSSSFVRSWIHNGEKKNHFIAPDGKEVWSASYVVGDTATQTDMLATVFCIISGTKVLIYDYEESFSVKSLVYEDTIKTWEGSLQFTSLL